MQRPAGEARAPVFHAVLPERAVVLPLSATARRPRLPHSPGNPNEAMAADHAGFAQRAPNSYSMRATLWRIDARRDARLAISRKPLTLWHATGTATRYRRAPRRPSCC